MLKLADGRKKLYQWDTDVKVNVEIDAEFVDFRLTSSHDLLRVEVKDKISMIPNILLQNGGAILAYANCVCNGQQTKCAVMFDVIKRPKPIDYVYTETELKKWDDLEERIEALEEREINVDSELNIESENPVQNKAVAKAVEKLAEDISKVNAPSVIVNTAIGETIVLTDSAESKLECLRVFGKTEQFSTTGKNLLELKPEFFKTNQGLSAVLNEDGSVTVNGTPANSYAICYEALVVLEAGTYFISGGDNNKVYPQIVVKRADNTVNYYANKKFEIDGTEQMIKIMIQTERNIITVTKYTLYPMLNKGDKALPFEPYTGGIPSPNPQYPQELVSVGDDGDVIVSVDGKTLRIPTHNGLPAIPVTDASLATYTDSNGQMWCADEVDFERGVYVKRVKKIVADSSLTYKKSSAINEFGTPYYMEITSDLPLDSLKSYFMSDRYEIIASSNSRIARSQANIYANNNWSVYYIATLSDAIDVEAYRLERETNPVTYQYILATPIETPLTEEEIAQYRALHTNYPVTTVLNDSDTHMEVKYKADTKNYIDNKFAEITSAILSMGGNI